MDYTPTRQKRFHHSRGLHTRLVLPQNCKFHTQYIFLFLDEKTVLFIVVFLEVNVMIFDNFV